MQPAVQEGDSAFTLCGRTLPLEVLDKRKGMTSGSEFPISREPDPQRIHLFEE